MHISALSVQPAFSVQKMSLFHFRPETSHSCTSRTQIIARFWIQLPHTRREESHPDELNTAFEASTQKRPLQQIMTRTHFKPMQKQRHDVQQNPSSSAKPFQQAMTTLISSFYSRSRRGIVRTCFQKDPAVDVSQQSGTHDQSDVTFTV